MCLIIGLLMQRFIEGKQKCRFFFSPKGNVRPRDKLYNCPYLKRDVQIPHISC